MLLDKNKHVFITALIAASITTLVYLPALQNNFVNWDDDLYVLGNPYIKSMDLNFLRWMFSFQITMWVPLTRLSHALVYAVWGLNPMGHHLINIIFHVLNTFLVVVIIIRLLRSTKLADASFISGNEKPFSAKMLITGGITGILFGIHPLHVESVAWVTERKDVLCLFFMLLSLFYYLKFIAISPARKRGVAYVLSLFFFIMALLSKPIAVTFPLILILFNIYPFKRYELRVRLSSSLKAATEIIPYLILSILTSIIIFVGYKDLGKLSESVSYFSLADRLLIAIRAMIFYLVKMVWPLNLSPLYPYPLKISVFKLEFLTSLILFFSISIFCIYRWKSQKIWAVVWAYYIVTLLPVLGIIQYADFAAADRYTYIPSLGPFLFAGLGVEYVWRKSFIKQSNKLYIFIPLALILCSLIILTTNQIRIWKNSLNLWNRAVDVYPQYERAYLKRGWSYTSLGKYILAIKDYDMAIKIKPSYAPAYNFRGIAYSSLGNNQKAIENFNAAIMINPKKILAFYNRGIYYKKMGSYQQAINDFDLVIKKGSSKTTLLIKAYSKRGELYTKTGNYKKAIGDYNKLIELLPNNEESYNKRGMAFSNLGDYQNSIKDFTKAINLKPSYIEAYNNRGNIYAMIGRYQYALKDFNFAIKLNPEIADIYFNRGMVHLKLHNNDKANKDFQYAEKLGNKKARNYLKTTETRNH
jgi:tetratricopeptide (TPR) repeat protein